MCVSIKYLHASIHKLYLVISHNKFVWDFGDKNRINTKMSSFHLDEIMLK